MEEYQIYYEYEDISGKFIKCYVCTVYNDYKKAENELCDIISSLEMRGCTNVQGKVVEIKE